MLNKEKIHGISWHIITDKVDAGDILKQATINISESETSLSLNGKCYETAIKSFEELLIELENSSFKQQKQKDNGKHCFYLRHKRPYAANIIDWSKMSSDDIVSIVNALDFGVYANPLGMPKILIDKEFFILKKAKKRQHF